MTLNYISTQLNSHAKCIQYLEEKRWNGKPKCPYCNSHRCSSKGLRYTCLNCSNSYSVTVGTFMENSNLPLQKWFMAIALMLAAKKGLSAMQLSRDISVNKNTAWLLQMKIRAAMKEGDLELFIPKKGSPLKQRKELSAVNSTSPKQYSGNFAKAQVCGYWNLFKRAIIGQYHKIDSFYLDRYLDEITFKINQKHTNDHGYHEILNRLLFVTIAK